MLTLEKLQKSEINTFIEIWKLAFYDNEYWVKKINEDLDFMFWKNDINIWEFYVLKLDNDIIWTSLLISRKHDLDWIDIFNVAIRPDLKWKWYWTEMMNLIFAKIKEYWKEYAFISTSGEIGEFYKKSWMDYFGKIYVDEDEEYRFYLYKKLK